MRRTSIITTLSAMAALAIAPAAGAITKAGEPTGATCTLQLFAQGAPNPTGIQFGLVTCPKPLGMGVHFDTVTVTPTSMGHGTVAVNFKNYFNRGTISGTVAITFAATSPMNIAYSGVVTYTGGTGKFRHVAGRGTIQCTTTDGGAHKSCTVNAKLTGV